MATYDSLLASLNPTGWWKLADAVGSSTAADSSGNGHTGTVHGTVTFGQTGPITGTPADTAMVSNGSTGYVDTNYVPPTETAFTALFWQQAPPASNEPFSMGIENSYNTGKGWSINLGSSNCQLILAYAKIFTISGAGIPTGTGWHMWGITFSGTTWTLYLDGVSKGTLTEAYASSGTTLQLAGGYYGTYTNTAMAQAAYLSGVALSSTQIAALYAARTELDLPGTPTNIVAVAGTQSATLSWTAPTPVPDAITGYSITPYISGVAQTPVTVGTNTSATLTGLEFPSIAYSFTVTAINALGAGSPSSQSNTVNPLTPTYSRPYQYSYNPFSYVCVALNNGSIIGEIPLTGVSFGKTLNGIGQFTGTIDLADPRTQIVDPIDLTIPGRTAIMVSYNGSLVAGYAAFASRNYDFQPQKRTLTLNYADLSGYFAQRTQATDYSSPPYSGITGPSTPMAIWNTNSVSFGGVPVGWDPVLMAWQVVSDALSVQAPYSNLLGGLSIAGNGFTSAAAYYADAHSTPSTSYVAQSFPFSSLQTIQTMVNQLASLGYTVGFDWGFDVAFSNGPMSIPVGTVNFSYPRRGRTVSLNNLVLDLRSAYSYSFPEDPSQEANTVYETGTAGCIVALQNLFPLEQGVPLLEKVISRAQIQSPNIQALLYNIGLSDLYLFSYPVVVPQVTVDLYSSTLQLGSFIEGDDVLLTLPANDPVTGITWDPRFPGGIYQEWRIQQWQAMVGDDGQSTLQLTFNQPPALTATGPAI